MENEEKMMTGEESLRIISEMINKTKVNIRQSSFHLLFWGWLIFACSITEYLLWKLSDFASPWYIWIFVVPGIFVSMIYGFKTGKKAKVHTYADYLYMWTWLGFMIAAIILFIMLYNKMEMFAPFILLLAGFPTFILGIILKFKPLVIGGTIFWIMALIVTFVSPSIAPLGMPVAVIGGYLIPGYKLRNKVKIMTRFKELDPILHSQLRLAVVSLLISSEAGEFTYIQEQTGATAGNLSIQISKLKEAGYIIVEKKFMNNYPQTLCKISPLGRKKFGEYVEALKDYLTPKK